MKLPKWWMLLIAVSGLSGVPVHADQEGPEQASFQHLDQGRRMEVWLQLSTGRYLIVFSGMKATVYQMLENEPGSLVRKPVGELSLSDEDLKALDAWLAELRKPRAEPVNGARALAVERWDGEQQGSKELLKELSGEIPAGLLTVDVLLDRLDPSIGHPEAEADSSFPSYFTYTLPDLAAPYAGQQVEIVIEASATGKVSPGMYSFTFSAGKVAILRGRKTQGEPVVWTPVGSVSSGADDLKQLRDFLQRPRSNERLDFGPYSEKPLMLVSVWKGGEGDWQGYCNTAEVWDVERDEIPLWELVRKLEAP